MITQAATIGATPARAPLPSYGDYFRAVIDLGRRSIRPALPALALLYFYRLGMGVYLAFSSLSYPDAGVEALKAIVPQIAIIASFLPMLLLVYTPFLPLQDGVLRGREVTFMGSIRRVLEVAWNFMLSGIVQVLILFTPFVGLAVAAGLMFPDAGPDTAGKSFALVGLIMFVGTLWFAIASLFLIFATPTVVLDGEGPVHSVGTSIKLVRKHLGGILGRLVTFVFFTTIVYFVAIMPAAMLTAVERSSGVASAPLKIAGVIWSSAIDSLFFSFWVAALMTLYRALVPAADATGAGAAGAAQGEEGVRPAANPLLFE